MRAKAKSSGTSSGPLVRIVALSAALSRYFLVEMKRWEQALCIAAALLLIAPGLVVTLVGAGLLSPIALRQLLAWKEARLHPRQA